VDVFDEGDRRKEMMREEMPWKEKHEETDRQTQETG
jgi:hypothetical protein